MTGFIDTAGATGWSVRTPASGNASQQRSGWFSVDSDATLQAVAMDGKSLRGTLAKHQRAIHLLSLRDQRTG